MSNTYKGSIGEQGAELDLAQINVQDWFSQFPMEKVSESERILVNRLIAEMKNQVVATNYTFSDPRFVMIVYNLLKRNLITSDEYNFTITEFLLVKQYFNNSLDEKESEVLNLFVDSYIQISLGEREITQESKVFLKESAEAIDKSLLKYCPVFLAEKLDEALNYSIEEIDTNDLKKLDSEDVIVEGEQEDTFISEIEAEEEEEAIIDALSGEDEMEGNRVEINAEEYNLLDFLVNSDFTSDGNGIMGVLEGDDDYSIKDQIRIAKGLSEKGVLFISTSIINGKKVTEASVNDDYQEESEDSYGGYRLVNLIFNGQNIEDYYEDDEKTIEEVVETKEEPAQIKEWRETIATLQEMIDKNDAPEMNDEWVATIEALMEEIKDAGFKFEYGGVTNRNVFAFRIPTWATPALINGDLSGLTYDEVEKLDEFVDNISKLYGNAHFMLGKDSYVVEFKRSNDIDGNIGGDVNTLYVKATLPRRMFNDGGMSDSDIRAEIERQEKKLSLASLPESAKDVIRKKIANLEAQLSQQEEKPKVEAKEEKGSMSNSDIRAEIERQEKKLSLASLPESAKDVIRKKIAKLEAQLSEDDEDDSMSEEQMRQEILEQETEAYYKEQAQQDSEIYAEIKRQEKKLLLASLPESAKQVIRKKIATLKGQLSTADEEPIEEAPKKKEKPQPKEKPIEKVIDKLEEIEEEEEEESPIQKALGKIKKVEEEPREPKKRGRKPKAKVEPTEPKIPQKRGRKPKPKVEVEPKVPQKRGRKPKPKLSLSDFGIGTKFNINDFI
jgi:hypothetical protein